MNPNESWIAEQARLLTLEDGFGPSHTTNGSTGSVGADVADEAEAATT
jgi:hypothetical protein